MFLKNKIIINIYPIVFWLKGKNYQEKGNRNEILC